jgi:hypothetical protein
MELSTDRLEAASWTRERAFSTTSDQRKRRAPRQPKDEAVPAETEDMVEEQGHQLDDIA